MTRLVCLYGATHPAPATLDPRVRAALELYAPLAGLETEWADTSSSLQAYADELEKRWAGEEDLILVEQDKEIFLGTLPDMLDCDQPWCGYTYWCLPAPYTSMAAGGFGVTRFSAQVQRLVPVSAFRGGTQIGIDRRFHDYLLASLGVTCHLHGHVVHHHVYEPVPESDRLRVQAMRAAGILPPAVYPEPDGPHLLPGSHDLTPDSTADLLERLARAGRVMMRETTPAGLARSRAASVTGACSSCFRSSSASPSSSSRCSSGRAISRSATRWPSSSGSSAC